MSRAACLRGSLPRADAGTTADPLLTVVVLRARRVQGQYLEALDYMERSLVLRRCLFGNERWAARDCALTWPLRTFVAESECRVGPRSEEAIKACKQVVDTCNGLATAYLTQGTSRTTPTAVRQRAHGSSAEPFPGCFGRLSAWAGIEWRRARWLPVLRRHAPPTLSAADNFQMAMELIKKARLR